MDRGMPSQASSSTASANQASFFPSTTGSSPATDPAEGTDFDVIAWHPFYQNCQRFFINHAQHSGLVQGVAAFINIRLPFQWPIAPITNFPSPSIPGSPAAVPPFYGGAPPQYGYPPRTPTQGAPAAPIPYISLIPYIRRLIITGFDTDGIMHGFFGSDWQKGVGPLQEIERRNYMFAAKSVGWAAVKSNYDEGPDQTVPFMKPLGRVHLPEIEKSEKAWSEWLAMEDWMVGPRAPEDLDRPLTATGNNSNSQRLHGGRDEMMMSDGHH
jgi:hypothetical protein